MAAINKTLFSSASLTSGTYYSNVIAANGFLGGRFYLDVSAMTSATSLTVTLEAMDKESGKWVAIPGAAFAAVSTTTTKTLSVYPSLTTSVNAAVPDVLGEVIRAKAVQASAATGSIAFSLSVDLMR